MKAKILVADDDEPVRKMVARVLESGGYKAIQAGTGREAVAKFRANQPALVLLDLKMPEEGGWSAFDEFSRIDPMMPVIIITAWPDQYEQAVRRGIDALMEKPLDLPLLLETIVDLLSESEEQRTKRLTDRTFTTAFLAHVEGPKLS